MAAFIQKKKQMKKQKTTESVEKLQGDSFNTNTSDSTWKDQKPTQKTILL